MPDVPPTRAPLPFQWPPGRRELGSSGHRRPVLHVQLPLSPLPVPCPEGWSRVPRIFGDPVWGAQTNPQGPRRRARHSAPPEHPRTPAEAPPGPGSPGPAGAGSARLVVGLSRPGTSKLGVRRAARVSKLPAARGARGRRGGAPCATNPARSWPTWPGAGRSEFAQVWLDAA